MSLDSELAALLARERRRTASILRDASEIAIDRRHTFAELLVIVARHIELGDEHGTLWGKCLRCRDDGGGPKLTEMPFGYADWS